MDVRVLNQLREHVDRDRQQSISFRRQRQPRYMAHKERASIMRFQLLYLAAHRALRTA